MGSRKVCPQPRGLRGLSLEAVRMGWNMAPTRHSPETDPRRPVSCPKAGAAATILATSQIWDFRANQFSLEGLVPLGTPPVPQPGPLVHLGVGWGGPEPSAPPGHRSHLCAPMTVSAVRSPSLPVPHHVTVPVPCFPYALLSGGRCWKFGGWGKTSHEEGPRRHQGGASLSLSFTRLA